MSKIENSSELNQDSEYHLVAYVKDTNPDNGPGHVSVSTVKKTSEKTKVNHTSFFPGAFGSLLNGLTLGSVPVQGKLADSHEADLEEAEHVLIKPVSKEEYKEAKKAQAEFSQEVTEGKRFYSVFGNVNPLATAFSHVFSVCRDAHLTVQAHKKHTGIPLSEDACDIPVYDNEHHVKAPVVKPDNCASSVTHVINKAGFKFANPIVPTFFTPGLEEQGFVRVGKDELESKVGIGKISSK